jgi:Flp pilus assembly protein TadD
MRTFTQASIALGQIGPAMDAWEQWSAKHPRDPQGPSFLGMLYESAGDQNKAIEYYQKSLQLQPDQPAVDNNLAFLMVENGKDTDVALSLAESAHQAMPDSPDTADTLAWVYYKKGIYASALDLLQGAARTDPNNATIQYHLGMTYSRLNNKAEAIDHLKKASQLGPDTASGKSAAQELSHLS